MLEFRVYSLSLSKAQMENLLIYYDCAEQILLQYYNSSLERDGLTRKIVRFGAVASISGGLKANYSISAPKVLYYSARGPDPEDGFLDDADIMKPNLVAPGNSIWAAWSSAGTDSVEFQGMNTQTINAAIMIACISRTKKGKIYHKKRKIRIRSTL